MARGPHPQPYSLHSTFPFPRPLPGRCDPPPPPATKLSHPQPLAGPSWEGASWEGLQHDPHPPRLLILLTAALPRGGPLEETLVVGAKVLLPARPDMWPALCRGLMAAGWG